ncbi:MAG TPA: hemerythrin domain-containing protein [Bacillus bacterium]|nr:hemerythrin domain-containing protein [Bacillus sp. (in: firmicutes)]
MSGPSLYKRAAHQSIHNGAFTEGQELLEVLEQVFREGQMEHATVAVQALIEHWETRTIAHAESEEDGFYQKKSEENPDLQELIIMLKRDHQLFRDIINDIKQIIDEEGGVNEAVIDRFKTLFVLNEIHNHYEETYLFDEH